MKYLIFLTVIIPIAFFLVWGIKSIFKGYEDDNKIEECIEDIIEHQTDIDIDLTPDPET